MEIESNELITEKSDINSVKKVSFNSKTPQLTEGRTDYSVNKKKINLNYLTEGGFQLIPKNFNFFKEMFIDPKLEKGVDFDLALRQADEELKELRSCYNFIVENLDLYKIIFYLEVHGIASMSELASFLNIPNTKYAMVQNRVNKLKIQGMIRQPPITRHDVAHKIDVMKCGRRGSPTQVYLELTDSGKKIDVSNFISPMVVDDVDRTLQDYRSSEKNLVRFRKGEAEKLREKTEKKKHYYAKVKDQLKEYIGEEFKVKSLFDYFYLEKNIIGSSKKKFKELCRYMVLKRILEATEETNDGLPVKVRVLDFDNEDEEKVIKEKVIKEKLDLVFNSRPIVEHESL